MPGGRIGCEGETSVALTRHCGGPAFCFIQNGIVECEWDRRLDDISTARVVIQLNPDCCACVKDIYPWCAEIHISRGTELNWSGVVLKSSVEGDQWIIEAADMLIWTKYRIPVGVLDNSQTAAVPIASLVQDTLDAAFAEDDPCVLQYVQYINPDSLPTQVVSEDFPAFPEDGYWNWLVSLSELGADITTLGRSIIVSVENENTAVLGTLTDQHILNAENLRITRDGTIQGNRFYTRFTNDDNVDVCTAQCAAGNNNIPCESCNQTNPVRPCLLTPCPAIAETDEEGRFCYGLVERVVSATPFGFNTAEQLGEIYLNAAKVTPVILEFNEGARLSPDTPFELNDLVCGLVNIRVALTEYCIPVFQVFKLQQVNYRHTVEGGEEITVVLGPLNNPAGSISGV